MGDWNLEPSECDIAQVLQHDYNASILAVTDTDGNLLPTRFEGQRAIDYGLTNAFFRSQHFQESRIGDHKTIQCCICPPENQNLSCTLETKRNLACPNPLFSAEQWHSVIIHWQSSLPGWRKSCAVPAKTPFASLRKYPPENRVTRCLPNEKVRIKDEINFFTTQGTLHRPTSGFLVRKLQRQVYRLAEMLAPERNGHTSSKQFRTLRCQVRPIFYTLSVAANLAAASAELSWPICGKLKLVFVCSSGEMLDVLIAFNT